MAKGKRAAALFEVIHTGRVPKPLERNSSRWWFSRRSQPEHFSAASIATTPPSAPSSDSDPEESPDDPTVGRDPQELVSTAAVKSIGASTSGYEVAPAALHRSCGSGVDVAVDPERQQITFQFSYVSAIVAGFAIVVAVMLAYLVGQRMSRGPGLAVASQTSEQLRAKPANPEVMNLPQRRSNANQGSTPAVNTNSQSQVPDELDSGLTSRSSSDVADHASLANGTSTTAPANLNTPRTLNLNYVVIQSYPDKAGAEQARDALLKAGIGCTIEQGLRGLRADWFTVVGTQGFQRQSSEECRGYMQRIEQISQQFAQGKRSFKAFQPLPYKWDKPAAP